jgi:hypothetical protein
MFVSLIVSLLGIFKLLIGGQDNDSLRAGRYGDRIPLAGEIFCARPERPPRHIHVPVLGIPGLSPGVTWPGRGADHPPLVAPRL